MKRDGGTRDSPASLVGPQLAYFLAICGSAGLDPTVLRDYSCASLFAWQVRGTAQAKLDSSSGASQRSTVCTDVAMIYSSQVVTVCKENLPNADVESIKTV
jgi:hypothetical protein